MLGQLWGCATLTSSSLGFLVNNSYFGLLLIPKMPPVMLFLSKERTNSHARALIGLDQSVQGQGEHSWRSWYNWSLEGLTDRIPLSPFVSCSLSSPYSSYSFPLGKSAFLGGGWMVRRKKKNKDAVVLVVRSQLQENKSSPIFLIIHPALF